MAGRAPWLMTLATLSACTSTVVVFRDVAGDNARPVCEAAGQPDDVTAVGAGTTDDPYLICGAVQLVALTGRPELWDKSFRVGADLDLAAYGADSASPLAPIGDAVQPFLGHFDGDGHTISNLEITGGGDYQGLFGYVGGSFAEIEGVHLRDVVVRGQMYVGGLAGYVQYGSVLGSSVTGSVAGMSGVGGLVGMIDGVVSTSWTDASVTAEAQRAGGLVGALGRGFVLNSYALGSATAKAEAAGGLVGRSQGYVGTSYALGTASGGWMVGGLVGRTEPGARVSRSFGLVEVRGNAANASLGRLVGDNLGAVEESFSSLDTSCVNDADGFDCHSPLDGETSVAERSALFDVAQPPLARLDLEGTWRAQDGAPPLLQPATAPVFDGCDVHMNDQPFAFGHGTPESPYLICAAPQLAALATAASEPRFVRLMGDLDMRPGVTPSVSGFAGIATFTGVFDGNGARIDGVSFDAGNALDAGLFGTVFGIIKRLAVTDLSLINVTTGGGLVGSLSGAVSDCYVTGSISGGSVGGLVGFGLPGWNTSVFDSYSVMTVSATDAGGGIAVDSGVARSFAATAITASTGGPISGEGTPPAESYYDAQMPCSGCAGGNDGAVDTSAAPDYFFSASNPPLDTWDFGNVWVTDGRRYPELRQR